MRITNVLIVTVFFLTLEAVLTPVRKDPSAFTNAGAAKSSGSLASAIQAGPTITNARLQGKKLIVMGENFDEGAIIIVNNTIQQTRNDWEAPTTMLVAKKAGKKVALDQIITIQVQNSNGLLSEGLAIYTGCGSQN
jgi:hypothetical protein